ncbi:MAG: carboxylating nicotinate-nucleotide diphosphorylase [Eubacteriales bacterium]
MLDFFVVDEIIMNALKEDIGWGDITASSTIPADKEIKGKFIAKEAIVVCGLEVAARVFDLIDADIVLDLLVEEGSNVLKGDILATISGNARGVLEGERVALNLLQRMSGIASRTRDCVEKVAGTKAMITDTRKTTPGLRVLEKHAVRTGGGRNHRFCLSDGVLIKDNHIKAAGGITQAVESARAEIPHTMKIEVEVEDFDQIREALTCGADIIMLDNMGLADMAKAVAIINGRAMVEASGNMGDKDLREVAATGVDIISIGALTHTVRAADISLRFE